MTLAALAGQVCIPNVLFQAIGTSGSETLDAAYEQVATTLRIWKAGAIRNVYVYVGTVTEEDNLHISLQSVNDGLCPSGTILGATNNGYATATLTDSSDNSWLGPFQLGEDVTVAVGDIIAVVVGWSSYTDGNLTVTRNGNVFVGSDYENITNNSASLTSGALTTGATYYIRTYNSDDDFTNVGASSNAAGVTFRATGTTPTHWAHSSALGLWSRAVVGQYCVALEYSDGTYGIGNFGAGVQTSTSMTNASSPDEVGNYVQFPVPFTATGFVIRGVFGSDTSVVLYDSNDNVLANATITGNPSGTVSIHHIPFDGDPSSSVSIAKDTYYRITVVAPAGSISPAWLLLCEAAANGAFDLGTNCVYTGRTNAGAWTETLTRRSLIGLIASHVDDGVTDYPDVGNVTEDDTVNGAAGTYHEATTAEVQSGVAFGASSALTGTYSGGGGGRPEIRGNNL